MHEGVLVFQDNKEAASRISEYPSYSNTVTLTAYGTPHYIVSYPFADFCPLAVYAKTPPSSASPSLYLLNSLHSIIPILQHEPRAALLPLVLCYPSPSVSCVCTSTSDIEIQEMSPTESIESNRMTEQAEVTSPTILYTQAPLSSIPITYSTQYKEKEKHELNDNENYMNELK
jgi:hypothetical protein